jgi:hypothetical protein
LDGRIIDDSTNLANRSAWLDGRIIADSTRLEDNTDWLDGRIIDDSTNLANRSAWLDGRIIADSTRLEDNTDWLDGRIIDDSTNLANRSAWLDGRIVADSTRLENNTDWLDGRIIDDSTNLANRSAWLDGRIIADSTRLENNTDWLDGRIIDDSTNLANRSAWLDGRIIADSTRLENNTDWLDGRIIDDSTNLANRSAWLDGRIIADSTRLENNTDWLDGRIIDDSTNLANRSAWLDGRIIADSTRLENNTDWLDGRIIDDSTNLANRSAWLDGRIIADSTRLENNTDWLDGRIIDDSTNLANRSAWLDGRIIADSTRLDDSLAVHRTEINAIQTLTGVAAEITDLGTFTGTTISDNTTIKNALQELETKVDGYVTPTLDFAYSNGNTITATDAKGAVIINLSETSDFVIQDAGVASFTVADNGQVTAAGNVDANAGLDVTGGVINLNNDATANGVNIGTGTNSGTVTIGNAANSVALPKFTAAGVIHNDASGVLSTSLIVNDDISATAGIIDTKLATISTAGKVSNSATTATNANTANAIVSRDASGNFSAGTITATTQAFGDNSTAVATTAFVTNANPTYYILPGVQSTTLTSLVNITGLSASLEAGAVYEFEVIIASGSDNGDGIRYGVNYTGSGRVESQLIATANANTVRSETVWNFGALTTFAYNTFNGYGSVRIQGLVTTTTAGTFSIGHAKVTSGEASAYRDTYLKIRRIQ